jgi:RecG-like helicase
MCNKPCISILQQIHNFLTIRATSTTQLLALNCINELPELRKEIQTRICAAADNQHTVLINHNGKDQHTHKCKHTYWGIPLLQE